MALRGGIQGTDAAQQKKEQQKAENAEGAAGGKKKKVTAAQLRVQKGILSADAGPSVKDESLLTWCPNLRSLRAVTGLNDEDRIPRPR